MTNGARPGPAIDVSLLGGFEDIDSMVDGRTDVVHEQDRAWQERLHEIGDVGAVALTRTRRPAGMVGCGRAHQPGDARASGREAQPIHYLAKRRQAQRHVELAFNKLADDAKRPQAELESKLIGCSVAHCIGEPLQLISSGFGRSSGAFLGK
jgi:hypothetical protein